MRLFRPDPELVVVTSRLPHGRDIRERHWPMKATLCGTLSAREESVARVEAEARIRRRLRAGDGLRAQRSITKLM